MSSEQFSLRWKHFHSNLTSGFHQLLLEQQLVDVTLSSEGQFIRAHKLILSLCSPYLRQIFESNLCEHPVLILSIRFKDLRNILTFVYQGEVDISQEDLSEFLKAAELLQIKGLSGDPYNASSDETTATRQKTEVVKPTENESGEGICELSPIPKFQTSQKKTHGFNLESIRSVMSNLLEEPLQIKKEIFFNSDDDDVDTAFDLPHSPEVLSDNNQPFGFLNETFNSINETRSKKLESDSNEVIKVENGMGWSPLTLNNNIQGMNFQTEYENGLQHDKTRKDRPRQYNCVICNKEFVNRYNLKIHFRDKHLPGSESSLACKICAKVMRNKSCLRVHLYSHRKKESESQTKPDKNNF